MQFGLPGLLAGTPEACAKTQCHTQVSDLGVTADLAKGGSFCQGLYLDVVDL